MNSDERRARIGEVRRRLAQSGPPRTRDRAADFETVTVPEGECDQLRDLLIAEGVQTVVEVGLAYASSALAIGEALVAVNAPRPRHIIIDPFQERDWSNVGWDLLRSAGLDSIASLVAAPSSIALPQLLTEGLVADAAFVDGSHRFHEVFVDLYFLRKIVRPGGLIVMDDAGAPSVLTAVRYYERNLGWTVVPGAFPGDTLTAVADGRTAPATRCQAMRLPDPPFEPPFEEFHAFWRKSSAAADDDVRAPRRGYSPSRRISENSCRASLQTSWPLSRVWTRQVGSLASRSRTAVKGVPSHPDRYTSSRVLASRRPAASSRIRCR
ncbi:class I SAM-dependent methyltransferase [Streptomyces sp. NPDC088760]|uniref:class I SAM-dependent methyltransferase n=2 Tax=unclassified Streptomyces TaxID=2593676 RepID=UPI0038248DDF